MNSANYGFKTVSLLFFYKGGLILHKLGEIICREIKKPKPNFNLPSRQVGAVE